jgi:ABC-type polysaccharide/polyol phosphate export permease
MVSVLDGIRWALLDQQAPLLGQVAASVGGALLLLAAALIYFRRTERFFADVI